MLVRQKRKYDCVLACLAMATGKEYDLMFSGDFTQEVEDAHGTGKKGLHDKAFELAGLVRDIDFKSVYCGNVARAHVESMLWRRRAMIQVPSLNYKGASHYVYWDGEQLFDPSGLQRYQWLDHLTFEWVSIFRN